ncbi:isocitrate lyase/PEP mutase family protein [Frigoriglobus tundricola]|uniref:Putative carboxyvinyl-carboxyphosphonate phosphorylmutase n=1 Tax=Frigoriglobus tundricola TaxID=2774151 RepID=A0A6M5YIS4_9BACT|nr:isocitrate lyase/phosphoenolpyruvate mutase family protein [Frigoriglobus tundricola]QJW93947.1 putative carboxyvinyl-carboxyphosphonate phosphorylmutase [Frigoriglobus tundricola]
MSQREKAAQFAALHVKGSPVVLYNAWDAGSAKAVAEAGAKAVATSSWAVAEAQGYRDGEHIPLELVERVVARIAGAIDVPVTADFEGGYSEDSDAVAENVSRLIDLGVVGINFEDRVVKGTGLYPGYRQVCRIEAIRGAAEKKGVGLFINARTDLFLGQTGDPARSIDEALKRARAYADAGASGFFVPGLRDEALIGRICDGVSLPVNVLVMDGVPPKERLAALGVARISYGHLPYVAAMSAVKEAALRALS